MITPEKVLDIIGKKDPYSLEQIQVISRYIFDKTKEDIMSVGVSEPRHQGDYILLKHMYTIAKNYYLHEKQ